MILTSQQVPAPQTELDPLFQKIASAPDQFLSDFKAKRWAPLAEQNRVVTLIISSVTKTDGSQITAANQEIFRTLMKIVLLARCIVLSDFETEKMAVYDALLTAACIVDLERTNGASCTFVDKSVTTTRSLLYCPNKKQVAVVASFKNAKLQERGSYKQITSSAVVSLADLVLPARSAVFAHTSNLDKKTDDCKEVFSGLKQLLKVTPAPVRGICSFECVVVQEGVIAPATTSSVVDIKALFEGYQGSLEQIIRDIVSVSALEKLFIMRDLVQGLIHLHKQNVIHGDIKPANALFSVDGTGQRAKGSLNDFDFAFSFEEGGRPSKVFGWGYYGSIHGTDPQHYGKEEKEKGAVTKPIEYYKELDAWALGCVLLQLWKHIPVLPWSAHMEMTYFNDFSPNGTHKNVTALTSVQKVVEEVIQQTIENPLSALVSKGEAGRSFEEKVESLLFELLRYESRNRMQLVVCEVKLTSLISEAIRTEAQLKSRQAAAEGKFKDKLRDLATSDNSPAVTLQKLNRLFDLVLNRDAEKKCQPLTREAIKRLLAAATKIASEKKSPSARNFFSEILKIFKGLQSARFEKAPLSMQNAWQLAAYCIIELKGIAPAKFPLYVSRLTSGLSHDLQFDPRSSLVTIIAGRAMALKSIKEQATFKYYKSAISFSLRKLEKKPVKTLYMQNNTHLGSVNIQVIVQKMWFHEVIKSRLPHGNEMPVLQPLSYRHEELATLKETNNYNFITAVYPEFQGSLQDIFQGKQIVSFQQKLSLAEQLLRKLCCLHQMDIALGKIKRANALFTVKEDGQVEAVWTDLSSAYLLSDLKPGAIWNFNWGIVGSLHHIEPQFFGGEKRPLTSQECIRLEAWAFGIMLHEFFIGPIVWSSCMQNCQSLINQNKGGEAEKSILGETQAEIQSKIEATIERPFKELSAKPNPTQEEQMKLLIWQLLRYKREERISLSAAYKKLLAVQFFMVPV